jgi:hypothetical protein
MLAMKAVPFKLVLAWLALAAPGLAQTAADPPIPLDVCHRLALFLQERGGEVDARIAKSIDLDEVRRYLREDNRFACRSAISIMHTNGVDLPGPLLDAIGVAPGTLPSVGARQ